MSKKLLSILSLIVAGVSNYISAQQPQFKLQIDDKIHHLGGAYTIAQDQQGYIWFSTFVKGLIRYDGSTFKIFHHEPENPNSPASNLIMSMAIDSSANIWLGHIEKGLDRFDAATNTFTHFRYDKADANSLSSDSLMCVMVDHTGNLWIGTRNGLTFFDTKTGKFARIPIIVHGKAIDSSTMVFDVYEDKNGIIWYTVFKGTPGKKNSDFGGLFQLDPSTGKQVFYEADPLNRESLTDAFITSIFEDSRGNFWVGTRGNGLHILDRKTGKFTRYLVDPANPGKLSSQPTGKTYARDGIAFIREDHSGKLWIGSYENGINWYDPETDLLHHFGLLADKKNNPESSEDTLSGYKDKTSIRFITAKDGTPWIASQSGNIYTVSYGSNGMPFFPIENAANAFSMEPNGNILWVGTDEGLIRKDLVTNNIKLWKHDPSNPASLTNNNVQDIQADKNGRLYLGTHYSGLDLFDPATEKFMHVKPENASPGSIMDSIHTILIENDRYLWLGGENGLAKVDRNTYHHTVYRYDKENEKGIIGSTVYSMALDKKGNLWVGNFGGLDRYISDNNTFKHYLKGYIVKAVSVDASGMIWVGTDLGLFQYDETIDQFVQFTSPVFSEGIEAIANILEDDHQNLWITRANEILKISADRLKIQQFKANNGIMSSSLGWLNNYKATDGRLFIGGSKGYHIIQPDELTVNNPPPLLNFSQLVVGGNEVLPSKDGILSNPIWKTEKINLNHNQNSFSVDFMAPDYNLDEPMKYQYQLENYDVNWNNLDDKHKASFFNVPPGHYTLHVRAINSEGTISEKELSIIISPPWWKTWWAYCLYALIIIGGIWAFIWYRSKALRKENLVLEQKVEHRTKQLRESIESLKAAQTQLVQSEKMASLGELTAGIAHEIQNPLNFVNNFSEINKEMVAEANEEISNGNYEEVRNILNDIKENSEKINHHGKRADAIVKGMLQHSRASSGQKVPTAINVLCDEYLRLAYHGLRAKDKSFNASFETDFDESIDKMNIVPQDIGRVLLNLINNAFYAVNERQKAEGEGYRPLVQLTTKNLGDKVEIAVKDNGPGIPDAIKEKIFQPFFTTKPTGQGTGLGLSLSYDIVKAHAGELTVKTKENEGTEFVLQLPVA